jgi:hypothetical protein
MPAEETHMDRDRKEGVAAKEAKYGERMIEVKVRFWTDEIEDAKKIRPRHGWSSGVVRMAGNKSHAIVPGPARPFNSLMEIGSVIERVLIEHDIVLHHSGKMRNYLTDERPPKPRS